MASSALTQIVLTGGLTLDEDFFKQAALSAVTAGAVSGMNQLTGLDELTKTSTMMSGVNTVVNTTISTVI